MRTSAHRLLFTPTSVTTTAIPITGTSAAFDAPNALIT